MNRRIRILCGACAVAVTLGTLGVGGCTAAARAETGATEANLTRLTAGLLGSSQFARHPLDAELAGKLLDRYVDALDAGHAVFLQSDLEEFAKYRPILADATRRAGDTRAAFAIFDRYLERLEQRVSYATKLLQSEKFDFTGHDVYSFDREHAPHPESLAAARGLWREELRAEYLEGELAGTSAPRLRQSLAHEYAQRLSAAKSLKSGEVLEIYLDALAHVYDPHSDYLGREQMEGLAIDMNLALFGIGASLETAAGYCQIREILPGGPAAQSGLLKAGDRIVAVGQAGATPVDVRDLPLSQTVELIRGPKGSTVTLIVLPAGAIEGSAPERISLVRDQVELADQRAKARIVDLPQGAGPTLRLGVIELPSFYGGLGQQTGPGRTSATADVSRLLAKLEAEDVRGILLDVRGNGGGSLSEAIDVTGLFIRSGPVVQTRGPAGDLEIDADRDSRVAYAGPLVVLTSRTSASASEILTGALADYGRAVVVGDSATFGKGTVQSILPLAPIMDENQLSYSYDPGALKLTIRKFYRPDGASTQLRGVQSDIVLPSGSDFSETSEAALKDPLPWDAVPAAPHEHWNGVAPYVKALRERSARRVAADANFARLTADVVRFKANLANKSVSLNEAERRRELAEAKARELTFEAAAKALRATAPRTYELTVKTALLPGLPEPVATASEPRGASPEAASSASPEPGVTRPRRSSVEDIELNESERILADYVELLAHPTSAAGGGPSLDSGFTAGGPSDRSARATGLTGRGLDVPRARQTRLHALKAQKAAANHGVDQPFRLQGGARELLRDGVSQQRAPYDEAFDR